MAGSESAYSSSWSDTSSESDDDGVAPAVAAAGASAAAVAAAAAPGGAGPEPPRVGPPLPADGGDGDGDGGRAGGVVRDADWRAYRRTLEWRCRWVEVRMAELREQERRYARLDQKLRAREAAAAEAAAAAQQPGAEGEQPPQEQPALRSDARLHHRRRRERRPARHTPAMAAVLAPLRQQPAPLVFLPPAPAGADSGSDSDLAPSALFDAAAAVHGRIHELFSSLAAHRVASGLPPAAPRPSFAHLTSGGPPPGGGGGGHQRGFAGGHAGRRGAEHHHHHAAAMPPPPPPRRERTVADFDISDVVGALGGGPKVVERAPHVDIATPGVRPAPRAPWELADARAAAAAHAAALAAAEKAERARRKAAASAAAAAAASAAAAERAGSSSEDTTDEAFAARHMPMEALEKKLRLGPAPGRGSGAVGRGQNGAAAAATPAAPGDEAAAADAAAPGLAAAPSCGAAAEWSVSRPDGPKRAHVLVIKRAEAV